MEATTEESKLEEEEEINNLCGFEKNWRATTSIKDRHDDLGLKLETQANTKQNMKKKSKNIYHHTSQKSTTRWKERKRKRKKTSDEKFVHLKFGT